MSNIDVQEQIMDLVKSIGDVGRSIARIESDIGNIKENIGKMCAAQEGLEKRVSNIENHQSSSKFINMLAGDVVKYLVMAIITAGLVLIGLKV